ncbi:ArnT family glycosyltransferase [Neisseria sp.]|uniref:ArnT family glycosyltransferase n=1 Tax=Neisseria sp. TaxID=192066 RepID=UPI0035A16388
MLTYTPPESRSVPTREKPWLLLLLAFAWLWPGVFSHDLWNPAEPQIFTAVEGLGGGGWLPQVFGRPFFDASPVYVWTAALFERLLSPWAADTYPAARFASVAFTALGLACCGMAGYRFLGRHHGRSVVLILLGSVGMLPMAHLMSGMSVVFAALSMVLGGFALSQHRAVAAPLLLGGGWVLLSLSGGLVLTAAMMLLALALLFSRQWRFRRYYVTLVGALVLALPLIPVYPLVLRYAEPEAFAVWRSAYALGAFGGFDTVQMAFSLPYYLKNLLWFALPAWPLAVWTACRSRIADTRWGVLALAWLVVAAVLLSLSPHRFQDHLIWLMPPLALAGAAQLDGLRRGAAAFINWFGIAAFGLFAVFLWTGFFAMNFGWPEKLAERSRYFSPYYIPEIDLMPMLVALSFTPLWLWAITRKHIRGRQAVTNWAAGVTLAWALLMTLFLPWLDAAKSHAPVVRQMEAALPPALQRQLSDGRACVAVSSADIRMRIFWKQYGSIPLVPEGNCRYRLVHTPKGTPVPQGSVLVWEGARPRNKVEGFALWDIKPEMR